MEAVYKVFIATSLRATLLLVVLLLVHQTAVEKSEVITRS